MNIARSSRGFCDQRDKGDKTYLIAMKVRYFACNQSVRSLVGSFWFWTNQTKVHILDYGQTTQKVNVSGLFLLPPSKTKREEGLPECRYQCSCNQDFPEMGPTASFVSNCLMCWCIHGYFSFCRVWFLGRIIHTVFRVEVTSVKDMNSQLREMMRSVAQFI